MKRTHKKLILSRETLTQLGVADLSRFVGGVPKTLVNPGCEYSAWSYDSCPTTECPRG